MHYYIEWNNFIVCCELVNIINAKKTYSDFTSLKTDCCCLDEEKNNYGTISI